MYACKCLLFQNANKNVNHKKSTILNACLSLEYFYTGIATFTSVKGLSTSSTIVFVQSLQAAYSVFNATAMPVVMLSNIKII